MRMTHEDYEQVGRWLDGEAVELTAAQRALAEEIAADASVVGLALDAAPPGGTLHRTHARLRASLPRRRRWAPVRWAAAAMVVAAVGVALLAVRPGTGNGMAPSDYVESFLYAPAGELEARAELLAEELAEYHVGLALGEEWSVELTVTGLEQELGDVILNESGSGNGSLWEASEDSL